MIISHRIRKSSRSTIYNVMNFIQSIIYTPPGFNCISVTLHMSLANILNNQILIMLVES